MTGDASKGKGDESAGSEPEVVPPEDRFLRKDPEGLWELGPVPGNALRVDVAKALSCYITQQWSKYIKFIGIAL